MFFFFVNLNCDGNEVQLWSPFCAKRIFGRHDHRLFIRSVKFILMSEVNFRGACDFVGTGNEDARC